MLFVPICSVILMCLLRSCVFCSKCPYDVAMSSPDMSSKLDGPMALLWRFVAITEMLLEEELSSVALTECRVFEKKNKQRVAVDQA